MTYSRTWIAGLAAVLAVALTPALLASQAGQATQNPIPLSKEFAPKPYTVAADDKIRLEFYNLAPVDDEMKKVYIVQADGTIPVKHVGAVRVHGLTEFEIQEAVLAALTPKIYREGVISVVATVTEERLQRVNVQGYVNAPGEKQLRGSQMTVSNAIAAAGNFSTMAGEDVEVRRVADGKMETIVVTRAQLLAGDDPPLIAGDTITVKQGHIFFVNGEVNSPGQKVWSPGMTVQKAVALAQGFNARGKLGHILRPVKDADGKVLKYEKKKGLKEETAILADDILVITRKWWG